MEFIVELTNIKLIKKYAKLNNIKYLLVSYQGLSFNYGITYDFEELQEIYNIVKNTKLKLILNAERLFSDDDLILVKELVDKEFFSNFEYITYSDFGFKTILENNSLGEKLIFRASTYLTNKEDVELYSKINSYVVVSSEISSNELISLVNNLSEKVIIDVFGQSVCFYSRRPLITNYFIYRNIAKDPNKLSYNIIEELREDRLAIIEDETGTRILEPYYHALVEELNQISNAELGIIGLRNLKSKDAYAVVNAYNDLVNTSDPKAFYDMLDNHGIIAYKGAYNIKSVLLKGGSGCE